MNNNTAIKVGDYVRSYDYDCYRDETGPNARYVEGTVVQIAEDSWGCASVHIKVERDMNWGEESTRRIGRIVTPPANGTPMMGDRETNFLQRLVRF